MRHAITGILGALLLVLSAAPAQTQTVEVVQLRGQVLNAETLEPVAGAWIRMAGEEEERGVLSDDRGFFTLESEPFAFYLVLVEILGYETTVDTLASTAPIEVSEVLIPPEPLLLEELVVLADRFERRRVQFAGPTKALGRSELLNRPVPNAFEASKREVPSLFPCPERPELACIRKRGAVLQVHVCVNELPSYASAWDLQSHRPWELHLLEIYDQGEMIRIYTRYWVERILRQGRRLQELGMTC